MSNPLDDLKKAFRAGLRIVAAVEPLVELQKMDREHQEDTRIKAKTSCAVCNGTLQVGEPGNEINCPACVMVEGPCARKCPTCAGHGQVGTPKHKVTCPVCNGTGNL